MMPSLATIKLIGYGVGALAAIFLVTMILGWKTERDHLRAWQADVITATVDAANLHDKAGKPLKLAAKDVPEQIRLLGKAIADVRQKTAEIEASDARHARDVEGRQTTISQESSHDYQAELARVRADYAERLRRAISSRADQGGGGKPPVPRAPSGAGGSDAAAAENGLPAEDALIATEQAIQLRALEKWVCDQGLAITVCPARTKPAPSTP